MRIASDIRDLAGNSGALMIARILSMGLGAAELAVVVRAVGVNDYGVIALVTAAVGALSKLFDFRLWETIVQYVVKYLESSDEGKVLATVRLSAIVDFGTGVVAFVLTLLIAPLMAAVVIKDPNAVLLVQIYAVFALVTTMEGTLTGTLRSFNKFWLIARLSVATRASRLAAVLAALVLVGGPEGVLLGYVVGGIVDTLLKSLAALGTLRARTKAGSWGSGFRAIRSDLRGMLGLMFHTNLHATLKTVNGALEVLLLGALSNPVQVGFYSIAKRGIDLIGRLAAPYYEAIYPQLAAIWASAEVIRLKRFLIQATLLVSVTVLPVTLLLIVFDQRLILLIVGEWHPEIRTILRLTSVGLLVNYALLWLHPLALVTGRAHWTNISRGVQTLLWIGGSVLLVPSLEAVGTAVVYLLASVIWATIMLAYVTLPVLSEAPDRDLTNRMRA